eukprot:11120525-Ditylum_brightwellii.AAC.1
MLVLMDSFDSTADPNPHVLSMFCSVLNFYISDDMDAVNPVVRENQILYVHLLRYLPADSIKMKTLREDEDLAETI